MEFKQSASILFSNTGTILKIFSWYLISLVITVAIGIGIGFPLKNYVYNQVHVEKDATIVKQITDIGKKFVEGESNVKKIARENIGNVKKIAKDISKSPKATTAIIFSVLFIYMIYTFLTGMSFFPISEMSDKLMSSNLKSGFYGTLISNFGRSVKYSAAKMLISLPLDFLIFLVMGSLFAGLYKGIKLFAFPLISILWLIVATVRGLLFAGWLPRWIHHPDEPVFIAFARGLNYANRNYKHLFRAYLTAFVIIYLISTGAGLASFGVATLILPGLYYFLFRLIDLVGYYKQKGMSFYTDANHVVNTVDYGYRMQKVDRKDMQHIGEEEIKEYKELKITEQTEENEERNNK